MGVVKTAHSNRNTTTSNTIKHADYAHILNFSSVISCHMMRTSLQCTRRVQLLVVMDTCKRCRSCRWRGLYLADSSEGGESLGTDIPDPVLKAPGETREALRQ